MNRRDFFTVTGATIVSAALGGNVEASACADLSAEVARLDALLATTDDDIRFFHWFNRYDVEKQNQPTEDRVFSPGKRIGDMTCEEMIDLIAGAYYQIEWLSAALITAAKAAAEHGLSADILGVRRDVDYAELTIKWAAKPIYVKEGAIRQETIEIDGISTRRSVEIDDNGDVLCVIAHNERMTEQEFADRIVGCRARYPDAPAEQMVEWGA